MNGMNGNHRRDGDKSVHTTHEELKGGTISLLSNGRKGWGIFSAPSIKRSSYNSYIQYQKTYSKIIHASHSICIRL